MFRKINISGHRYSYIVNNRLLSKTKTTYFDHCFETVRKYDYENFLCLLLLPEGSRASTFAIRAFNTELAQIRDTVTDRKLGLARIQFWKDTVEKIYTKTSQPMTPVSAELAKAVEKHRLTQRWLTQMILAREERLLSDAAFSTWRDVENYAEKSISSVLYLILECLHVKNVHADHAASHIGKAQGITTLIRATPYHAKKNMVYLPMDLMVKHNVSQEEVARGCREQKMRNLICDLATDAHRHLDTGVGSANQLPKSSLPAFLPSVTTRSYLKALERTDYDVFDARLSHRNHWLPLNLWIHKIRGKF